MNDGWQQPCEAKHKKNMGIKTDKGNQACEKTKEEWERRAQE